MGGSCKTRQNACFQACKEPPWQQEEKRQRTGQAQRSWAWDRQGCRVQGSCGRAVRCDVFQRATDGSWVRHATVYCQAQVERGCLSLAHPSRCSYQGMRCNTFCTLNIVGLLLMRFREKWGKRKWQCGGNEGVCQIVEYLASCPRSKVVRVHV